MTTKPFVVSEFRELRAMQRVFREAKFCTEEDDEEISDSPIVAAMFSRLMEAVIDAEVELDGESARTGWTNWLMMTDTSRDEWSAAIRRAQRKVAWQQWSDEKRKEYVKILFAPFVLSNEMTSRFIADVTTYFVDKQS
jgi:hypothetical protein